MLRILLLCFAGIAALGGPARAQLPRSNIYMVEMQPAGDTAYRFQRPRWLTSFNRDGYNNHPCFIDDQTLYIASQMPGAAQPDLYALNLRDNTLLRVTATAEGEFSPARTPDYYNFSAVRMEFQGRDTLLRLWQFPIDRKNNGRLLLKYQTNIGYHQWLNSQQVAVYMTERPNALGIADIRTDQIQRVTTNVGRALWVQPNGALLFVQKSDSGPWQIMEYNAFRKESTKVVDTLPGVEDFALLADGTLLMASGSKLFKHNRLKDKGWIEIADFTFYNISNITRMAASRDGKLALVAN